MPTKFNITPQSNSDIKFTTRVCSKCEIERDLSFFYKRDSNSFRTECKLCSTRYRNLNKTHIASKKLEWSLKNKEYLAISNANYYASNKQKIKTKNNKYIIERKKTDFNFKLIRNLRIRLNKAIKNNYKSGSAVNDLGSSVEELKFYLESKFQPGMTWTNYGGSGWHIDHIRPLSSFDLTNPEQFKVACHYTNLQPLWAKDNLRKGSKYE